MSWNFILLIFINVRCDVSSLYSRINYVHSPDGGTSLRECPGIIKKTMHTGFSAYTVLHYANAPGADTEETGRYDLAWKDLCSVLNAQQIVMNYQYSNIFYVHGYL